MNGKLDELEEKLFKLIGRNHNVVQELMAQVQLESQLTRKDESESINSFLVTNNFIIDSAIENLETTKKKLYQVKEQAQPSTSKALTACIRQSESRKILGPRKSMSSVGLNSAEDIKDDEFLRSHHETGSLNRRLIRKNKRAADLVSDDRRQSHRDTIISTVANATLPHSKTENQLRKFQSNRSLQSSDVPATMPKSLRPFDSLSALEKIPRPITTHKCTRNVREHDVFSEIPPTPPRPNFVRQLKQQTEIGVPTVPPLPKFSPELLEIFPEITECEWSQELPSPRNVFTPIESSYFSNLRPTSRNEDNISLNSNCSVKLLGINEHINPQQRSSFREGSSVREIVDSSKDNFKIRDTGGTVMNLQNHSKLITFFDGSKLHNGLSGLEFMEETKPFVMEDYFKYSQKFKRKTAPDFLEDATHSGYTKPEEEISQNNVLKNANEAEVEIRNNEDEGTLLKRLSEVQVKEALGFDEVDCGVNDYGSNTSQHQNAKDHQHQQQLHPQEVQQLIEYLVNTDAPPPARPPKRKPLSKQQNEIPSCENGEEIWIGSTKPTLV